MNSYMPTNQAIQKYGRIPGKRETTKTGTVRNRKPEEANNQRGN